ncbi:hypothetical protein MKEN_00417400 [Mycena kentingensis (nom. inval.)]|nr:hypothetical protein MKEN_00417400 [Mycena kentingensis (nom. inval.)]
MSAANVNASVDATLALKRKRAKAGSDDEDGDFVPEAAPAKKTKASKPRASAAAAATAVGTCSLSKKEFGDQIKAALRIEKYDVQRMRINMTMDVAFFRSFFGGHAKITPAEYNKDTPVVVAELSNAQAGEVFGVSKVKNGNRMVTLHLQSMMVVFYPPTGKASAWLTV